MALATQQTALVAHQPVIDEQPKLLTIPRELRDEIIALCIRSGDMNILCICSTITEEALHRIKHEAIFRVNFNIPGRLDTIVTRVNIPAGIQNVDIRLRLPPGRDPHLENAFRFSSIRHLSYRQNDAMGCCTFTIEAHKDSLIDKEAWTDKSHPGVSLSWTLYYALSGYRHFSTLIIKLVREDQHTEYWNSSPQRRLFMDSMDTHELRKRLVPALGPAKFIKEDGKGFLEFHPCEHTQGKTERSVDMFEQHRLEKGPAERI